MKYTIIIFVTLFIWHHNLFGRTSDSISFANNRNFASLIYVSLGFPVSSGSSDFFSIYLDEFKGQQQNFRLNPALIVGTKFRFEGGYRLGASFTVLNTTLHDIYNEHIGIVANVGNRIYSQSIEINDIPIILTGEYLPYTGQFRTYIGGGLGFIIRQIKWNETISSDIPIDYRKGGLNYDESDVYPTMKIYSGVELGFDKMSELTFLGSLIIEVSYNYSIANTDLFSKVKKQFVPPAPRLDNKLNLLPGYFSFTFGLTFNFNKPN